MDLVEREHHQSEEEEGKVGEMRYVTKLRDSELSIRWIDRREEDLLNMIGKTMLSDLLYFLALTCNVKKGGHQVIWSCAMGAWVLAT